MNLNTKQTSLLLILTIILGGFLRFWQLGSMPPSLNWDEVSHGYNAYSILKTGMDEWGIRFPLIFKAFGDFKLPAYIYLTTIPVWLFGLNAFAVRFISALAGTFAILGIYLLTNILNFKTQHKNSHIGLITAFLLAISPWHFFISRPALEANLALTFIIFGFYYLLKYINGNKGLFTASLLLGLSLHTYNTARVFVPLMLLAAIYIYRSKIKLVIASSVSNLPVGRQAWQSSAILIISIVFFVLSVSVVAGQIFSGEATARYSKLQILSESVVFQIGESRSASKLPSILPKLIYNRPVYFVKTVTENYLKYFSPQFFYQTWGAQFQFAIPNKNLLTLPIYLLSILGFVYLLLNFKNKSFQFILSWLLLSPIAASLTVDPPQALRPNPMIPAIIIISTIGLTLLNSRLTPKIANILIAVILLWTSISFVKYLIFYNNNYKNTYSSSWQYGYSQVIDYITNHSSEYKNIFITKRYGEPHIFYVFYSKLNPLDLQPNNSNIRFKKSDWFWTDKIGKVYFINDWQIPTIGVKTLPIESGEIISTANSLLITSPDHLPINAHLIKTINFLNGSPAYIISSIP